MDFLFLIHFRTCYNALRSIDPRLNDAGYKIPSVASKGEQLSMKNISYIQPMTNDASRLVKCDWY